MKEFYLQNKAFLNRLGLLLVLSALVVVSIFLMGYIAPFVAGYVISLILSPAVDFFERRWNINRVISAIILILLTIAAIFAAASLLINRAVSEMKGFTQNISYYIDSMMQAVEGWGARFNFDFDAISGQVVTFLSTLLQDFIQGGNILLAVPAALFRVLLAIISAFFFIKDKGMIKEKVASILPVRLVSHAGQVRLGLRGALGGYAKGQLIIMVFVATICVVGLTILRSPYSIFVGIGIAIFDVIPIFGAGGIFIPWVIYSFVVGNTSFGIGLIVVYAVVFLTRQILEPKIVGRRIGIHPLMLLMSVYVGILTLGPIGILAGPLIVLIVKNIMEAKI